MRDIDEIILGRRSIRGFRPDPVPRDTLLEVLSLAQQSPSNCNVQPWRVYIASGERCEKLRERLTTALRSGQASPMAYPLDAFKDEYRKRQVECAAEMYGKMGIAREDVAGRFDAHLANFRFFGAPHVAFICMDASFGVGVALDVGMYVHSLMLLLWSRGIGSCAQAALRAYEDITREELGIPDTLRVVCGLSFGYEDESVPANATRQARQPVEQNVTFVD
ncbi:MAG: nitroreductase [Polyangiaceae bacterium]|nr:nitroreductase [Polyangiaceae bacterium]